MQQYQAPPGGYTTGLTPKNPAISLLISFIVPGVGTIINGETGKGIAILVAYIVSLILIIALIGLIAAPAVWIFGMYDAYQGAKKFNLAIVESGGAHPGSAPGTAYFVLHVGDFDRVVSDLRARGLVPIEQTSDAEGRFATFRDPEGNQINIWGK